ncbi:MAG: glycosyltransferase family 1 protein [Verrucomicrobiales bacterium]|nr:glycosyltransferase family 1 protein [Verrucomicrobiales bacterium]
MFVESERLVQILPVIKVAHLLRKYNPDEWGGTEAAVKRLVEGLRRHGTESVVFGPQLSHVPATDPFAASGFKVRTFRAILPIWRISEAQRQELIAIGGNIFSFDLIGQLMREKGLSLINTHATNRLGGTALTIARLRKIPVVVTIHGGLFDLPASVREQLAKPARGGIDWGKGLGLFLRSKKVIAQADAIVTCNVREAELISQRFPRQRVVVQPHGVSARRYQAPEGETVDREYPQLKGHPYLLVLGRLDPVKNQGWLLGQAPELLRRYPDLRFVLAGSCTNEGYGTGMQATIAGLGLEDRVIQTGGLPPEDPRLIGLLQRAKGVVVPSLSETFGLVILEAWAAGTPVISSKTSGALGLVKPGENGWLFDLEDPAAFHTAVDEIMTKPDAAAAIAAQGMKEVAATYDSDVLASKVNELYAELIERGKRL